MSESPKPSRRFDRVLSPNERYIVRHSSSYTGGRASIHPSPCAGISSLAESDQFDFHSRGDSEDGSTDNREETSEVLHINGDSFDPADEVEKHKRMWRDHASANSLQRLRKSPRTVISVSASMVPQDTHITYGKGKIHKVTTSKNHEDSMNVPQPLFCGLGRKLVRTSSPITVGTSSTPSSSTGAEIAMAAARRRALNMNVDDAESDDSFDPDEEDKDEKSKVGLFEAGMSAIPGDVVPGNVVRGRELFSRGCRADTEIREGFESESSDSFYDSDDEIDDLGFEDTEPCLKAVASAGQPGPGDRVNRDVQVNAQSSSALSSSATFEVMEVGGETGSLSAEAASAPHRGMDKGMDNGVHNGVERKAEVVATSGKRNSDQHVVMADEFEFKPARLRVRAGDSVQVLRTRAGPALCLCVDLESEIPARADAHSIRENALKGAHVGDVGAVCDAEHTFQFLHEGTYCIRSEIYAFMRCSVVVCGAALVAPLPPAFPVLLSKPSTDRSTISSSPHPSHPTHPSLPSLPTSSLINPVSSMPPIPPLRGSFLSPSSATCSDTTRTTSISSVTSSGGRKKELERGMEIERTLRAAENRITDSEGFASNERVTSVDATSVVGRHNGAWEDNDTQIGAACTRFNVLNGVGEVEMGKQAFDDKENGKYNERRVNACSNNDNSPTTTTTLTTITHSNASEKDSNANSNSSSSRNVAKQEGSKVRIPVLEGYDVEFDCDSSDCDSEDGNDSEVGVRTGEIDGARRRIISAEEEKKVGHHLELAGSVAKNSGLCVETGREFELCLRDGERKIYGTHDKSPEWDEGKANGGEEQGGGEGVVGSMGESESKEHMDQLIAHIMDSPDSKAVFLAACADEVIVDDEEGEDNEHCLDADKLSVVVYADNREQPLIDRTSRTAVAEPAVGSSEGDGDLTVGKHFLARLGEEVKINDDESQTCTQWLSPNGQQGTSAPGLLAIVASDPFAAEAICIAEPVDAQSKKNKNAKKKKKSKRQKEKQQESENDRESDDMARIPVSDVLSCGQDAAEQRLAVSTNKREHSRGGEDQCVDDRVVDPRISSGIDVSLDQQRTFKNLPVSEMKTPIELATSIGKKDGVVSLSASGSGSRSNANPTANVRSGEELEELRLEAEDQAEEQRDGPLRPRERTPETIPPGERGSPTSAATFPRAVSLPMSAPASALTLLSAVISADISARSIPERLSGNANDGSMDVVDPNGERGNEETEDEKDDQSKGGFQLDSEKISSAATAKKNKKKKKKKSKSKQKSIQAAVDTIDTSDTATQFGQVDQEQLNDRAESEESSSLYLNESHAFDPQAQAQSSTDSMPSLPPLMPALLPANGWDIPPPLLPHSHLPLAYSHPFPPSHPPSHPHFHPHSLLHSNPSPYPAVPRTLAQPYLEDPSFHSHAAMHFPYLSPHSVHDPAPLPYAPPYPLPYSTLPTPPAGDTYVRGSAAVDKGRAGRGGDDRGSFSGRFRSVSSVSASVWVTATTVTSSSTPSPSPSSSSSSPPPPPVLAIPSINSSSIGKNGVHINQNNGISSQNNGNSVARIAIASTPCLASSSFPFPPPLHGAFSGVLLTTDNPVAKNPVVSFSPPATTPAHVRVEGSASASTRATPVAAAEDEEGREGRNAKVVVVEEEEEEQQQQGDVSEEEKEVGGPEEIPEERIAEIEIDPSGPETVIECGVDSERGCCSDSDKTIADLSGSGPHAVLVYAAEGKIDDTSAGGCSTANEAREGSDGAAAVPSTTASATASTTASATPEQWSKSPKEGSSAAKRACFVGEGDGSARKSGTDILKSVLNMHPSAAIPVSTDNPSARTPFSPYSTFSTPARGPPDASLHISISTPFSSTTPSPHTHKHTQTDTNTHITKIHRSPPSPPVEDSDTCCRAATSSAVGDKSADDSGQAGHHHSYKDHRNDADNDDKDNDDDDADGVGRDEEMSMLRAFVAKTEDFLMQRWVRVESAISNGTQDRLPSGRAVPVLLLPGATTASVPLPASDQLDPDRRELTHQLENLGYQEPRMHEPASPARTAASPAPHSPSPTSHLCSDEQMLPRERYRDRQKEKGSDGDACGEEKDRRRDIAEDRSDERVGERVRAAPSLTVRDRDSVRDGGGENVYEWRTPRVAVDHHHGTLDDEHDQEASSRGGIGIGAVRIGVGVVEERRGGKGRGRGRGRGKTRR